MKVALSSNLHTPMWQRGHGTPRRSASCRHACAVHLSRHWEEVGVDKSEGRHLLAILTNVVSPILTIVTASSPSSLSSLPPPSSPLPPPPPHPHHPCRHCRLLIFTSDAASSSSSLSRRRRRRKTMCSRAWQSHFQN